MVDHPKKHHLSPRTSSEGRRERSRSHGSVDAGSGISSRNATCFPEDAAKPPGDGRGMLGVFIDRVFLKTFEIFTKWKFWNWNWAVIFVELWRFTYSGFLEAGYMNLQVNRAALALFLHVGGEKCEKFWFPTIPGSALGINIWEWS